MSSIADKHEHKANAQEIFNEMCDYLNTSLLQLVDALEKHNVEYRLDSGTLLGAYRNSTNLTKDSDHDISITIEELMKPNGQAFLKEYADNFRRCKRSTKSTVDGKLIEVFTDAETMLARINSKEPFVMSNLGWEALFDGKPYKYKSHTRRIEHKIDVFVMYPWNSVENGKVIGHAENHHVYSLPFFGEHFARIPSTQVESTSIVDATYKTFDSTVSRSFPAYADVESYLVSIYGETWQTPSTSYHWHGRRKYIDSKIFTSELLNDDVKSTLDVQKHYKFNPSLLNS